MGPVQSHTSLKEETVRYVSEREAEEIWSTRGTQTPAGGGSHGKRQKERRQPLGEKIDPSADSQRRNNDLSLTVTREWFLPTTCISLEVDSRQHFVGQYCDFNLKKKRAGKPATPTQTSDLRDCEIIHWQCFKMLRVGENSFQHQQKTNTLLIPKTLKTFFF